MINAVTILNQIKTYFKSYYLIEDCNGVFRGVWNIYRIDFNNEWDFL